jgi:hypothetical protein
MPLQLLFDKPSLAGVSCVRFISFLSSTPTTLEEAADWGKQAGQAVGMVVGQLRALAAEAAAGPGRGGGVARRRRAVRVLAVGGNGVGRGGRRPPRAR